jgi:uncharacterized membrane protein YcaP (DUF421 family)
MVGLEAPDWAQMFVPDKSVIESFLRGTAVYFTVLILVRIVPKRQVGSVGLTDVLLLVLLSECVSTALTNEAVSVANGAAAVLALLFWNFVLDWLAYRWPWFRNVLEPQSVQLVRDGELIQKHLHKERLAEDELLTQLRLKGFDSVDRLKAVFIEPEGKVSVVPKDPPAAVAPGADQSGEVGPGGPDFDSAVRRFLESAKALRESVDWHEARAAEHRKSAKEAREALARHGLRGRKVFESLASPDTNDHGRNGHAATVLLSDDEEGKP